MATVVCKRTRSSQALEVLHAIHHRTMNYGRVFHLFFHCVVQFVFSKNNARKTRMEYSDYIRGLNVYIQYNKRKYSIHGSYWNMRQQTSPVLFHSFALLVGSFPQVGMNVKNLWKHHPANFFQKLQRFSASGDVRRKIPQCHSVATLRRWDSSFGHWPRQGLRRTSMSVEGGGQIFQNHIGAIYEQWKKGPWLFRV